MEERKKSLAELMAERRRPSREAAFRDRVLAQVKAMADEAIAQRMVPVLVEVLAGRLAAVAYRYGPLAAGDILAKLGGVLYDMASHEQARHEALQELVAGRKPH
jgi:hypothetical protein